MCISLLTIPRESFHLDWIMSNMMWSSKSNQVRRVSRLRLGAGKGGPDIQTIICWSNGAVIIENVFPHHLCLTSSTSRVAREGNPSKHAANSVSVTESIVLLNSVIWAAEETTFTKQKFSCGELVGWTSFTGRKGPAGRQRGDAMSVFQCSMHFQSHKHCLNVGNLRFDSQ